MKRKKMRKRFAFAILVVLSCCSLFPIYWMINTSLKNSGEIYLIDPTIFPKNPTLENYKMMFENTAFLHSIWNSLKLGLIVTAITVVMCVLFSYAVARIRFRGAKQLSVGILYCYLIPKTVLFIPLYILVSKIGLMNNILGLILIYPTFTIPYAAWILIPYIRSIPMSIEEAAMIDGCTRLGVIRKIIVPLAAPGIISTAIFTFTMCWGEYLYALMLISKKAAKPYPLMLTELIEADVFAWGPLMAAAIIVTVPVLILYMFGSKFIVNDLSDGGVKQ